MKRSILIIALALVLCSSLSAAGTAERSAEGTQKPVVAVSILPQSYFVNRLAGSLVDTVVLVGDGQSPHSYEPTPGQMEQLSKAKAWILSGTDFELALEPKVAAMYPDLLIVDGTEGVTFRTLGPTEKDDDEPAEASGINKDRHTWLGEKPAEIMIGHIRDTLVSLLPGEAEEIGANYDALTNDIESEFASLHTALAPLEGRNVFVYHPAFGYFFDEFGIVQKSVETGGKEPTAKALGELIAEARADRAAAIFVQAQFPVSAAETVANAVGARVVPLNPLAYDWLANIRDMGNALLTAATAAE